MTHLPNHTIKQLFEDVFMIGVEHRESGIPEIDIKIDEKLAALKRLIEEAVIGADEFSKHVRRFQCPDYGKGCHEWAEQWKMNSEPPYCSVDGRKMKSVEFDEQDGDDWTRNALRATQREAINTLFGKGE